MPYKDKLVSDINSLIKLADFYNTSLDFLVGRNFKEEN